MFSKYVILAPLPDKSATTVTNAFRDRVVSAFGIPLAIRSDNGSEFWGAFQSFAAIYHITRRRTSPFHSNANGQAERYLREVGKMLRVALRGVDPASWSTLIPELQLVLNSTHQRSIGCSPYLLMFGGPPTPLVPSLRAPQQLPDLSPATLRTYG